MTSQKFDYIVGPEEVGRRLDRFLTDKELGTRAYIQKLIAEGLVTVDERQRKAHYTLRQGEKVEAEVPAPEPLELKPEKMALDIVYEDDDLIVINKPSGLVVHPGAGIREGTLVNGLLAHCGEQLSGIGGVQRPGIVHRLDKETSGVLVVAKSDRAHQGLSVQFADHSITRMYNALVWGHFEDETGTIRTKIGRDHRDRKKMSANPRHGRDAVTHFKVKENIDVFTLLDVTLETGRTHQIRVHLSYIGHPVVGDTCYGRIRAQHKEHPAMKRIKHLKGQALHAGLLGFIHPVTEKYVEFTSPLPDKFQKLLDFLSD